jgi:hypothetical protein
VEARANEGDSNREREKETGSRVEARQRQPIESGYLGQGEPFSFPFFIDVLTGTHYAHSVSIRQMGAGSRGNGTAACGHR